MYRYVTKIKYHVFKQNVGIVSSYVVIQLVKSQDHIELFSKAQCQRVYSWVSSTAGGKRGMILHTKQLFLSNHINY